jgi:hypothetical protein
MTSATGTGNGLSASISERLLMSDEPPFGEAMATDDATYVPAPGAAGILARRFFSQFFCRMQREFTTPSRL